MLHSSLLVPDMMRHLRVRSLFSAWSPAVGRRVCDVGELKAPSVTSPTRGPEGPSGRNNSGFEVELSPLSRGVGTISANPASAWKGSVAGGAFMRGERAREERKRAEGRGRKKVYWSEVLKKYQSKFNFQR